MKRFFRGMGTFSWALLVINLIGVVVMACNIIFVEQVKSVSVYSNKIDTEIALNPYGLTLTIAALIISLVLHIILLGISKIGLKVYEDESEAFLYEENAEQATDEAVLAQPKKEMKKAISAFNFDTIRSRLNEILCMQGYGVPCYNYIGEEGLPPATINLGENITLTINSDQIELTSSCLSSQYYVYFSFLYEACSGKSLSDPFGYFQRIINAGGVLIEDNIAFTYDADKENHLFSITAVRISE